MASSAVAGGVAHAAHRGRPERRRFSLTVHVRYDHNAITAAIGLKLRGKRREEPDDDEAAAEVDDRNEIHFHSRRSSLPFRARRFGIAGGREAEGVRQTDLIQAGEEHRANERDRTRE